MTRELAAAFLLCLPSAVCGAHASSAKPRIAVVIDDFGLTYPRNAKDEDWLALDFPITFAVMPESPRTRTAARAIRETGHELIVHFPFDPFLALDLPKDRVSAADRDKVGKLLAKSLRDIPGARGLNTHRSYRATLNRPLMAAFMRELKGKAAYFLDSRAAPRSVAYDEARRAGLPAAANDFFLEEPGHYDDAAFCARILRRAAALARRRGSAVVIGHHYYQGTLSCVRAAAPKLKAEGFELVFASALAR